MAESLSASTRGSGTIAPDHSVAVGAGGVAAGRDIHGDVTVINVICQVALATIPSPWAVAKRCTALRERLEADACAR